ncbi:MAG: hypothetical protein CMJ64_14715 [Planctomycetaceae bacterium]|nr:hypothetical protein [Planctomycetaceae bacterium]
MQKNSSELRKLHDLLENGFVVIENVLCSEELECLTNEVNRIMAGERSDPIVAGDGPERADDEEIATFLRSNYSICDDELQRMLSRIRHTRAQNLDTSWPVEIGQVNKTFIHLPTLFDQGMSQRIWNLLGKATSAAGLPEQPIVLDLVRSVLGADRVLSDCSATSIGPHTDGGAWHVDVPLGQLSERLPDFPLTTQNAWMLDDFSEENGATRVVPGSHLSRRKPRWSGAELEGEIALTAPAGSVAIWLSNTWHRSGANRTDSPRRAILCYYCRSWIKPFNDFRRGTPAKLAAGFSPTLRYLLGWSATAPVRG